MFNCDNLCFVSYKQEVTFSEKPQVKINSLMKYKHTLSDKSFKCTIENWTLSYFIEGHLKLHLQSL